LWRIYSAISELVAEQFGGSVPARDLYVSDRLGDEALALAYLVLLDEYGMGELIGPTEAEGAMR
jgi:hypothetical protein